MRVRHHHYFFFICIIFNSQNASITFYLLVPFEAISFLPINLQSDIAIAVYLDLLTKVKLFQDCERNLLYSLVLKLKPITYMPGDYVCKKGEVGREMYIIDKGIVEVVVNDKAVAQMKEGSVFGEISLLSMGAGGNRRTANVVSKGFSRLLILQKSDLNEVLQNYPGMEAQLRQTARYAKSHLSLSFTLFYILLIFFYAFSVTKVLI